MTSGHSLFFSSSHRRDLGSDERIKIGLIALFGHRRGRVGRLSARYNLSRTSIYHYRSCVSAALASAFNAPPVAPCLPVSEREESIEQLLVLRFEGGCSISSTAAVLKRSFSRYQSVGFVSATLQHLGGQLPNLIAYQGRCCWACDEIYYCGKLAILVSVEPISGAILHISLAEAGQLKAAWLAHWQRLNEAGIYCQTLVTDEGVTLRAAREDYLEGSEGSDFQADTFHAIAHRLGVLYRRLEKNAYQAIETEYDRQSLLHDKQTPNKVKKYALEWAQSQVKAQKEIQLFDDFSFLYRHLLQQLNVFDANGLPRRREVAQQEAQAAIELMHTLDHAALNKALKGLLKLLPNVFAFLDKAQTCYQQIIAEGIIETHRLPFVAKAWQYLKTANKVKNNYPLKKKLEQKAQQWLSWLQENTTEDSDKEKKIQIMLFNRFDNILQASSSVEMVNSFLRPLLNQAKDQIYQHTLNLFMDYYNHRPFKKGKRKGKKPIEIINNEKNDTDWFRKIATMAKK